MECGDIVSQKYCEYWKKTVNALFNRIMGTQGRDYLDKTFCLDFNAETWEDTLRLQSEGELYGLSHNRILEMARKALAKAIDSSKASRGFQSGFAIDSQGFSYPPEEKAENIYRVIREGIQEKLKPYWLEIDELLELYEMTYEKEETSGSLAFFPSEKIPAGVEFQIELDSSVNDNPDGPGGQKLYFDGTHLREIRKLLAGITPEATLLFTKAQDENAYICRGFALLESLKGDAVPPIRVHLRGRMGGTFYADGVPWFRLCGSQILAPIDFYRIVQAEICQELGVQEGRYEGFFQALSRQSKGAAAVFVDLNCKVVSEWYQALASYGRAWKLQGHSVMDLNEEQQKQICALSRIDGALIVDISSGNLAYAGVVLDALGITEGRRDRGARKNSVLAHVANLALLGGVEQSIAAAVYSEDGMVTSVLGSSYYGDRTVRLAKCAHPLIKKFREN